MINYTDYELKFKKNFSDIDFELNKYILDDNYALLAQGFSIPPEITSNLWKNMTFMQ